MTLSFKNQPTFQASTSSYCVVLVGTFIDKLTALKEDTVQIVIDRLIKKLGEQAPKLCPVSCINMEGKTFFE